MFQKTKKLLYLTVILLNSVETFAFTPSIPTLEQVLRKKEGCSTQDAMNYFSSQFYSSPVFKGGDFALKVVTLLDLQKILAKGKTYHEIYQSITENQFAIYHLW